MIDHDGLIAQQIPRLRRYARALTGDRSAADDLVQDTLERAVSRFHLWRHGSDLRAWLFTIMHNIFVNQARSRAHHQHEALEADPSAEALRGLDPEWLELRDLASALARVPDEQRIVLLLVGLEQFTYDEAARILEIGEDSRLIQEALGHTKLETTQRVPRG